LQRVFYRRYLDDLDRIDRKNLSRANQVDYLLLRHELRGQIWSLDTLQEWAWNPIAYTQLTGGAIYSLMAREFAPIDQRLKSATARLERFPCCSIKSVPR